MKENIDVQFKCIDIERKSIDERNKSLGKLDQKIGIFAGFFFLFFIESLKIIWGMCFCIKLLFILVNIIGIIFLMKSFFIKKTRNQYFNVTHMIDYEKANYKLYIKDVHADYIDIKQDLDVLIESRNRDFKTSIIFFGVGLLIVLFMFIVF